MILKDLERTIKNASQAYYEGHPIMADIEFDELLEELRTKDANHPLLTQIGHGYVSELKDAVHPLKITRGLPKQKVDPKFKIEKGYITPKYDGSSVTLYYTDGILTQAITRGDGITGKDVTDKLKLIVPNKIDARIQVVTGEWLLSFENAAKYYPNEQAIRNIATGMLSRKTFTADEIKRCHFVAYRINKLALNNNEHIDRLDILKMLRKSGFLTPDVNIYYNTAEYEKLFKEYSSYSHCGYTFLYDGLVYDTGITINNGEVFYNNEVAYKILTETAEVTVENIEWNRSDKGKFKPVIVFNEVKLSGASIRRATGFNAKYILDNQIGEGTVLKICRSGEVIPYVLSVIEPTVAELPTYCLDCGKKLVWDGVDLVCANKDCGMGKYLTTIKYIKTISNIKSASTKVITKLIEFEDWKDVSDIYKPQLNNVDFTALYAEDGFGDAAVELVKKVFKSLYENIDFVTWLTALNIKNLSTKNANKYANDIKNFLDSEDMKYLNNLTPALFEIISDNKDYMIKMYKLCKEYFIYEEKNEVQTTLKVCITGKLSIGRRLLVAEFAKKGIVESSIQSADILICNEPSNSSKYKYAVNNNVPIMTENEFMNKYFN